MSEKNSENPYNLNPIERFFDGLLQKGIISLRLKDLAENKSLTENFFEKYIDVIFQQPLQDLFWVFVNLLKNENITFQFFEKYENRRRKIFDLLLEETDKILYQEKWIYYILTTSHFPEEYFEDKTFNQPKFSKALCENPNLSEGYIRRRIERGCEMYWEELGKNKNLSEDFFEEYLEKVTEKKHTVSRKITTTGFYNLSRNSNISEEFFEIHYDKLDFWSKVHLCRNSNISLDFHRKRLGSYTYTNFEDLSLNPNLPESFFRELIEKELLYPEIKFGKLLGNISLSDSFVMKIILEAYETKNEGKLDWIYICHNSGLSEGFFDWCIERDYPMMWSWLLDNLSLSEGFFRRHFIEIAKPSRGSNSAEWSFLSSNPNLSFRFIEKLIDYEYPVNFRHLAENSFQRKV